MSAEKLAAQLEQIVRKRIQEDSLVLPTLPSVVKRINEILQEPEVNLRRAAEVIEQDPVLAARALRAGGTGPGKKATVPEALGRMGPRAVRALLADAAGLKMFVSRDAKIAGAARKLWEHSVAVGNMARDVSALSGYPDSPGAYVAGLLHDLGKYVVMAVLLELERQMTELYNQPWIEFEEWIDVVGRTHRAVGMALAERWQLPDAIAKCIRDSSEYDNSDRSALVNAVCFGNALAKKATLYSGPVDADDVDALVMIGRSLIGVSDDVLKSLTMGLRERVSGLFD
ncbi:HDOD domain-containing protein [Anaeromyxobacter paludicola]|uniref:Histidine kinase n=1 Tax=Anaeromyxobacter paludicola TaxID=2918171 RepID=A0ABN6N491_9BACT|nr:HDOD domain-containing protein [Anaeromyxobacter paludicola]BDG07989.1 histidine kinase [Anaeromyxobacter paludicola]